MMKTALVAKNRIYLAVLLVTCLPVWGLIRWLTPEEYQAYLQAGWWVWLGGLLWLAWSFIAPALVMQPIKLEPEMSQAFNRFEDALAKLEQERGDIEQAVTDARMYAETLMRLIVGFLEQGDLLQARIAACEGGRGQHFYDPAFASMITRLDERQRSDTLAAEIGILTAQRETYLIQAEGLRLRVIEARGRIAQQQTRINQAIAAVPLLNMDKRLVDAEGRLIYLNRGLADPRTLAAAAKQQLLLQ
jgi:hypothetical protein